VLPKRVDSWSFTSLQQRLVKTGGRLVKHVRDYWLLLAESHLTRRFRVDALADLGATRANRLTDVPCRRSWAKRTERRRSVDKNVGGVVRRGTIRAAKRVFNARSIQR